ncbi:MAG: DNA-formamidopyrimidine glycosylase family protein [Ferruginibacter sp.]
MPEGPSIVILKEAVIHFKGKKIQEVGGNAKIDMSVLKNKTILDLKTWGKHFIILVKGTNIRIHFLLFGSFSVDEQTKPDRSLRLFLKFKKGSVYFYTCSVRILEGDLEEIYDWTTDVMNPDFDIAKARKKLKALPGTMACEALLDQTIFAGVGNIIKNEVLYRIRLHPETLMADLPTKKLTELIKQARQYSFEFLEWKKAFVLKKNWLAYTKKICKRCDLPFIKKYCGKTHRRSFFCKNCQVKY